MTPASPCVVCLTTGGATQANTRRPARVDLTRYGITGVACYSCYQCVLYRHKHGLDVVTGSRITRKPEPEPLSSLLPRWRRRNP